MTTNPRSQKIEQQFKQQRLGRHRSGYLQAPLLADVVIQIFGDDVLVKHPAICLDRSQEQLVLIQNQSGHNFMNRRYTYQLIVLKFSSETNETFFFFW